jgi:hypothetical protein
MTAEEREPFSAARIGFFVGGAVGIALIVPGLDGSGPGCLWLPMGGAFTVFLASRRRAVDLASGLKGGAVCGIVAALVVIVSATLSVVRDPVAFARDTRHQLVRLQPDEADGQDVAKAIDQTLREKEDLAATNPRAAIVSWIGFFAFAGLFVIAVTVIGALFGVYLFKNRAPPDEVDGSE